MRDSAIAKAQLLSHGPPGVGQGLVTLTCNALTLLVAHGPSFTVSRRFGDYSSMWITS
jgi:hypothetical protein